MHYQQQPVIRAPQIGASKNEKECPKTGSPLPGCSRRLRAAQLVQELNSLAQTAETPEEAEGYKGAIASLSVVLVCNLPNLGKIRDKPSYARFLDRCIARGKNVWCDREQRWRSPVEVKQEFKL